MKKRREVPSFLFRGEKKVSYVTRLASSNTTEVCRGAISFWVGVSPRASPLGGFAGGRIDRNLSQHPLAAAPCGQENQPGRTIMRSEGLAFGALAAALILALGSTPAVAQDAPYALSYFSNAHTTGAPDGVLRLVNDGF